MGDKLVKNRRILCLCFDVTEDDIIQSLKQGYDEVEILKRFTSFGMGPCQGKMCVLNVLEFFAAAKKEDAQALRIPTLRPPIRPVNLEMLGSDEDQGDGSSPGSEEKVSRARNSQ